MSGWAAGTEGLFALPSGRCVRGRGLRAGLPPGESPEFGVYLLGGEPSPMPWETRWVAWPDFRLPRDGAVLRAVLGEALAAAGDRRVEIACAGGRGRTGTALACLAILDGVPGEAAVGYVRARYHPRAVETWPQRRFVRRFGSP